MTRLNQLLTPTPSKGTQSKRTVFFASLSLGLLWILASVVSEGLEQFSFWLETSFAVAQWFVLRRYLQQISWWVLVSVWGWSIAFILIQVVGVGAWIGRLMPGSELEISLGIFGFQGMGTSILVRGLEWAVIGACQWLLLRCYIENAGGWIVASAIGGAIKGGLELLVRSFMSNGLAALVGALGYGLVTGIGIILLLNPLIQNCLERQHNAGRSSPVFSGGGQ